MRIARSITCAAWRGTGDIGRYSPATSLKSACSSTSCWKSRAQRHPLLLADDRDHRRVVELGVVEAVEQVDRARARGRHAHADLARELGVGAGGEGGELLVAQLDELDLLADLVEGEVAARCCRRRGSRRRGAHPSSRRRSEHEHGDVGSAHGGALPDSARGEPPPVRRALPPTTSSRRPMPVRRSTSPARPPPVRRRSARRRAGPGRRRARARRPWWRRRRSRHRGRRPRSRPGSGSSALSSAASSVSRAARSSSPRSSITEVTPMLVHACTRRARRPVVGPGDRRCPWLPRSMSSGQGIHAALTI